MLNTSPSSFLNSFQCAKFAQPGPRELWFQGMTSPDSSPGLVLHVVISGYSGSHDLRSSLHINPITFLQVCCTLCLPNALLNCEPSRLPHALTHNCFLPFYPLHSVPLPSVTWLWSRTQPLQTSWVHRVFVTPRIMPWDMVCLHSPSSHMPCHTFSMLYSYHTTPSTTFLHDSHVTAASQ